MILLLFLVTAHVLAPDELTVAITCPALTHAHLQLASEVDVNWMKTRKTETGISKAWFIPNGG